MIYFYRFLWIILSPIVDIWFIIRIAKGKEDKKRIKERLGFTDIARPDSKLIWFHCASVGESLSILPLIKKLLEENADVNVLVTTGTVTSANLMTQRLPKGAIHQYVPIDFYFSVKSFMEHWKPDVSIFVESELWPELCRQAPNPMIINGRVGDKSAKRYKKYQALSQFIFKRFKLALMQSDHDKKRLESFSKIPCETSGNLKFDAGTPPVIQHELDTLKKQLEGKRVIVYASTHAGEEVTFAALGEKIRSQCENVVNIIVPRHPNRGEEIEKDIKKTGIACTRRSAGETLSPIYIADTLGEMGLWYTVADVVFIGKSLIPGGGQNPYEPLKCGKVTLCGPHMENFKEMMDIFTDRGIILQCKDIEQAEKDLVYFVKNDKQRALSEKHIKDNMQGLGGATNYTATKIIDLLRGYN